MAALARSIKFALPGAIALGYLQSGTVHNEPKRKFYEDDENVTPIPGTIVPASASEIESLGPNKLIDGISVRSPPTFEKFFNSLRQSSVKVVNSVEASASGVAADYYNVEHKFTGTIASLHDKRERLLPGGLYIVTAALTGSIIARRKNILLRVTAPVALGLVAFKWALPSTFNNTSKFAYKLEKQNIPAITEAQDIIVKKVDNSIVSAEATANDARSSIESLINRCRLIVASVTGLNIDEDSSRKK